MSNYNYDPVISHLLEETPFIEPWARNLWNSGKKLLTMSLIATIIELDVAPRQKEVGDFLNEVGKEFGDQMDQEVVNFANSAKRMIPGIIMTLEAKYDQLKDQKKGTSFAISVSEVVKFIHLSVDTRDLLKAHAESLKAFGMRNSHTYREKLFRLFEVHDVNPGGRFFVYFLASLIKNKGRILTACDKLPSELRDLPDMIVARQFIQEVCVHFTHEERDETRFAVVHLPNTFPGLDIYCACLMLSRAEMSVKALSERQTFSQLALSSELQAVGKEAQRDFWDNKVKKTNSSEKSLFKAGFQEEFYENMASDKYFLVIEHDQKFVYYPPQNVSMGYTNSDFERYFDIVNSFFE